MRLLLIAAAAMLAGCVAMENVAEVGPDRYQFGFSWGGGIEGAERDAHAAANKKCASLGKQLGELSIATSPDDPADGHAMVTFNCR